MSLSPGSRLSRHEVTALIGSGGMGGAYRAKDTKLRQDVAFKVLPDLLANDPERLARLRYSRIRPSATRPVCRT